MRWSKRRAWCALSAWLAVACARDEVGELAVGEAGEANEPARPAALDPTESEAPGRGVGAVCINEAEHEPLFSGFTFSELNIETRSTACDTRVCVTAGFQGRVSCPYGQIVAGRSCRLPGSDNPVEVPVEPQLVERPPEVASFCSCRCSGPGRGPFCNCPDSMECSLVFPYLGPASENEAGSYCVPRDAAPWDGSTPRASCDPQLANCEDRPGALGD